MIVSEAAAEIIRQAPLSIVKTKDGVLRLECNGVRMNYAQVALQCGVDLSSVATINIPLDHIELLTERDVH